MINEKIKYGIVCLISFLLMPVYASANMVWPSLYIAEGMRSWYVILIGLVIEILFVKYFLKEEFYCSLLLSFQYLKNSKEVKAFKLNIYNDGETIVEI